MKKSYAVIVLLVVGVLVLATRINGPEKCYRTETKIVRGNSLQGLIEPGSNLSIAMGFYECNPVERGDVIIYGYSGNSDPVVKIVKAVPGDSWGLVQIDDTLSHLNVNGQELLNSEGEAYEVNQKEAKLLSLYIRDYHGFIPANAYLILGNIVSGSLDSRHFGLVAKQDLQGKVLRVEK